MNNYKLQINNWNSYTNDELKNIDNKYDNTKNNIFITGRLISKLTQKVLIHIINFKPFVYVSFNKKIQDHIQNNKRNKEYIREYFKSLVNGKYNKIITNIKKDIVFVKRKKIMSCDIYNDEDTANEIMVKIFFNNDKQIANFKKYVIFNFNSLLNQYTPVFYDIPEFDITNIMFELHEYNIDCINKFTGINNINSSGVINIYCDKLINDKICTENILELVYDCNNSLNKINNIDVDIIHEFNELYFDIECMQSKYKEYTYPPMPNPEVDDDVIFQISMIYKDIDKKVTKYLLVIDKCDNLKNDDIIKENNVEDTIIIQCKNESKLLNRFAKLVNLLNVDLLIGYNIFGFDIPYMLKRSEILGCDHIFKSMGILKPNTTLNRHKNMNWESSGRGIVKSEYLDIIGILMYDVLIEIKSNHTLKSYTLENVSQIFLKVGKDPLSAIDLFKLYDTKDSKNLSIIGKYCIIDSLRVYDLVKKLNLYITSVFMSIISCTSILMLQIKGQQEKTMSQLFRETYKRNIVIQHSYKPIQSIKYDGAWVGTPMIGMYKYPVLCNDFTSLYPTTIQAYNIDPTTFINDSYKNLYKNINDIINEYNDKYKLNLININDITQFKLINYMQLINHDNKDVKQFYLYLLNLYNNYHIVNKQIDLSNKIKDDDCFICEYTDNHKIDKKYRFIKNKEGLIPSIISKYLKKRKAIKQEMKQIDQNTIKYIIMDKIQWSLKISINSIYGIYGFSKGFLAFIPGAECTTAMSKKNINIVNKYVDDTYNPKYDKIKNSITIVNCSLKLIYDNLKIYPIQINKDDQFSIIDLSKCTKFQINDILGLIKDKCQTKIVYGDSVTGDTPILLKNKNGNIEIKTIESLSQNWEKYNEFKLFDSNRKEKQQSICNFQVWSRNGWTDIKRVIRHKTIKKIYRISTHTGIVDVSEDHSLLNSNNEIIKPNDCIIGKTLLLQSYPDINDHLIVNNTPSLIQKEAFIYGMFYSNGHCNLNYWTVHGKKLNKLKQYLIDLYQHFTDFKISNKSIICDNRYIIDLFKSIFYDKNGYKIIPNNIINGDYLQRLYFLIGLNYQFNIINKGKIGSAHLYYLIHSLGYNINISNDKPDIYHFKDINKKSDKVLNKIKKIIYLRNTDKDEFIYDIETKDGSYQAGIGNIIVKNTDSLYIEVPGATIKDTVEIGNNININTKLILPNPLNFAYEKTCYPMFILSRKKYFYYEYIDGQLIDNDIKDTGSLLTRRTDCKFLKEIYKKVLSMIYDDISFDIVFNYLFDKFLQLLTFQIDYNQLSMNMSMSGVYKSESSFGSTFKRKMKKKGIDILPGTRFNFIYTVNNKKLQGDKAEDIRLYESEKYLYKHIIDYKYYIIKKFANPIDQLLYAKYKMYMLNNKKKNEYSFIQIIINKQNICNEIKELFKPIIKLPISNIYTKHINKSDIISEDNYYICFDKQLKIIDICKQCPKLNLYIKLTLNQLKYAKLNKLNMYIRYVDDTIIIDTDNPNSYLLDNLIKKYYNQFKLIS